MIPSYLQPWSNVSKNLQKPLLAMTDLTIKTLKNMTYIKPQDLSSFHNPHDWMDKQVSIFIQNSQNSLDYFQETFKIVEDMMMTTQNTVQEKAEEEIKKPYQDFIKPKAARTKKTEKTSFKKATTAQKKTTKPRKKPEKK